MSRPSKKIAPASLPRLPEIWPISVVLPAPFGPIRACTSPRTTSSVTSSVATTPPKRFDTARSSSIAASREKPREPLRREHDDGEEHDAYRETAMVLVVRRERAEP